MYEEFLHPTVIANRQKFSDLMAARRTRIQEYLIAHDMEITEEIIDKYYRGYRKRIFRKYKDKLKNTGLYLFAELPSAFLDLEVPNALPWNEVVPQELVQDGLDEQGFPNMVPVKQTFREYLVISHISLDETKVLFALGGKPHNGSRSKGVTAAEVDIWKALLESRGYDWNNIGNMTQWKQRLNSSVYL